MLAPTSSLQNAFDRELSILGVTCAPHPHTPSGVHDPRVGATEKQSHAHQRPVDASYFFRALRARPPRSNHAKRLSAGGDMPRQSEYRSAMSHSHVLLVSQSIAATQTARGDDALASTGPLIGTQLTAKVVSIARLGHGHMPPRQCRPQDPSTSLGHQRRHLAGSQRLITRCHPLPPSPDVAGFHEHRTEAHKFATQRVFLHAFGMRMRASTTSAKLHPRGNDLRSKASWPSAAAASLLSLIVFGSSLEAESYHADRYADRTLALRSAGERARADRKSESVSGSAAVCAVGHVARARVRRKLC